MYDYLYSFAQRTYRRVRSVAFELFFRKTPVFLFSSYKSRIAITEKVVALTFDDGPYSPYTEQLLEVLEEKQVKATFFCIGENLERHPEVSKLILQRGHEIGNHTYSHPRLLFQSFEFVRSQIERTDMILKNLGAPDQIYFRAPYGLSAFSLYRYLKQHARLHILFDFFPNPTDWSDAPSSQVVQSVVKQSRPGSIIVLHDGNPVAAKRVTTITREVVDQLRDQGYRFATVSELLRYETPLGREGSCPV